MMLRHARTVGLTAAAAGLAAFVWAGPAFAAFGDPDLIWGSSGVATADIAGVSSEGALALSGDTAGGANAFGPGISVGPFPGQVGTAALWANDGVQINTRRSILVSQPTAVARQPDGRKFLVLGEGSIARVFFNGNPDEQWGFFDPNGSPRGGLAGIPRPLGTTTHSAKGVAVQDDGKVVAAGTADGKVFVARLIGGGTLQQQQGGFTDKSFGDASGTRTFLDPTALSESAAGVAADADTIYVGGDARLSDGRQGFVLYRLSKADGSLVSRTFREVTAPEGGTPRATDLVRLADGRLVVAGGLENGTRGVSQGALVSYQKSGTVDSAFGQNGLVLDKALTTEFRYTTAFGRIFGLTRTADGYALTAYKNAAGEIDFSWGGTGLVSGAIPERGRQGDDDRHHDGLRTGQAPRRRLRRQRHGVEVLRGALPARVREHPRVHRRRADVGQLSDVHANEHRGAVQRHPGGTRPALQADRRPPRAGHAQGGPRALRPAAQGPDHDHVGPQGQRQAPTGRHLPDHHAYAPPRQGG